jgi:hypothetical protein
MRDKDRNAEIALILFIVDEEIFHVNRSESNLEEEETPKQREKIHQIAS